MLGWLPVLAVRLAVLGGMPLLASLAVLAHRSSLPAASIAGARSAGACVPEGASWWTGWASVIDAPLVGADGAWVGGGSAAGCGVGATGAFGSRDVGGRGGRGRWLGRHVLVGRDGRRRDMAVSALGRPVRARSGGRPRTRGAVVAAFVMVRAAVAPAHEPVWPGSESRPGQAPRVRRGEWLVIGTRILADRSGRSVDR